MRFVFALLFGLGLSVLSVASLAASPTVIVLSWDGIRWDYPDRASFPGLKKMEVEGARGKLTAIYPSKTFPTHVSMATGTYPDRHGIMDNSFWDPETELPYMVGQADWIQAEPLWIAAERQGVKTATYFWVGSESDWHGQGTSFRKTPFDGRRPESEKVAQYLSWLDLPESERPHLIMGYWAGADTVGHQSGPDHPAVVKQLAAQDQELQQLLQGLTGRDLWDSTTLIIVSDHGMIEVSETVDVHAALTDAGIDARVNGSSVAQIFLQDAAETAQAKRVLDQFATKYPMQVYTRDDLPPVWRLKHATRTGDLVVTVEAPYQIVPKALQFRFAGVNGSHGFDPDLPELKAAMFALGRGVKTSANIVDVHQIELAATVAALLGIDPPLQSEGKPMTWLDRTIEWDERQKIGEV